MNNFNDILDEDEQIVKIIKPNKKRYWRALAMPFAIPLFWPHLIIILVLSFFTFPFLYAKAYKNLCYCYTNKRIIQRKGMFGVQYKSMDFQNITETNVKVGFLDRKINTGNIWFSNRSGGNMMHLPYVNNPYAVMKEIKSYINSTLNEQK